MSEITNVIAETHRSLRENERVEESGLTITLDELERCRAALDGLGDDFVQSSQEVQSIIDELKTAKSIGYTWGFGLEIFFQIIRLPTADLRTLLENLCPEVSISDEDLDVLKQAMLKYRRKPIGNEENERTVGILEQLLEGTSNEQLESELVAMISLLQLAQE